MEGVCLSDEVGQGTGSLVPDVVISQTKTDQPWGGWEVRGEGGWEVRVGGEG